MIPQVEVQTSGKFPESVDGFPQLMSIETTEHSLDHTTGENFRGRKLGRNSIENPDAGNFDKKDIQDNPHQHAVELMSIGAQWESEGRTTQTHCPIWRRRVRLWASGRPRIPDPTECRAGEGDILPRRRMCSIAEPRGEAHPGECGRELVQDALHRLPRCGSPCSRWAGSATRVTA